MTPYLINKKYSTQYSQSYYIFLNKNFHLCKCKSVKYFTIWYEWKQFCSDECLCLCVKFFLDQTSLHPRLWSRRDQASNTQTFLVMFMVMVSHKWLVPSLVIFWSPTVRDAPFVHSDPSPPLTCQIFKFPQQSQLWNIKIRSPKNWETNSCSLVCRHDNKIRTEAVLRIVFVFSLILI